MELLRQNKTVKKMK